jgi:apolipoprotein N-acyltransferase
MPSKRHRRPRVPARVVSGAFRIQNRGPAFLLAMVSLILLTLSLPPAGFWPLAYICLVPWTVCVCTMERSRRLYLVSYVLGVLFFAINAYWLFDVTPPGYGALCLWFGLAFPLSAWPVRHMFRRYSSPVAITLPIAWTAFEFLRGQTLTGFPWFYLAHTHYKVTAMTQIADFIGAYGLSFVIAMFNGWITDLMIQPIAISARDRPARSTRLPIGTVVTLTCLAATIIYGRIQLAETRRIATPGPRVAVLQMDMPLSVAGNETENIDGRLALESFFVLARQAAVDQPDLIVMPETACQLVINREFTQADENKLESIRTALGDWSSGSIRNYQFMSRRGHDALCALARETGATIVVGASAMDWRSDLIPQRLQRFNSAYVFTPDADSYVARYDKIHLVLFGEFVPFRYGALHGVYEWLNGITPWGAQGMEYSLSFGETPHCVQVAAPSLGGRTFQFATPICYEDVISGLCRHYVGRVPDEKQAKFLVNLSNDGWFNHSAELEQHLAAGVFRAIEYRVPIARSVNTGISVFVDATGHIHNRVRVSREQAEQFEPAMLLLEEVAAIADRLADGSGTNEERTRLDTAVERAIPAELGKVSVFADPAGKAAATSPASRPSTTEILSRLREPLAHEFDYLRVRLHEAYVRAANAARSGDPAKWAGLAEQARTDLRTLTRWRDQTQTAPGFRVADLRCDPRQTIYAQWGDWFSVGCVVLTALMYLDWTIHRVGRPSRRRDRKAKEESAA